MAETRVPVGLFVLVIVSILGCVRPSDFDVLIEDSSMEPTYSARDVVRFRLTQRYNRGEVVAFEYPFAYPGKPRRALVARLIGLPGDRVQLGPEFLIVNGRKLSEPYAKQRERMVPQRIVVLPGSYFVLGDDRNNQRDSRWWGQLPADKLLGRAVTR